MAPVVRADFGTLGRVERTPSGGLRVPAGIAREGVLHYADGTREWNEFVPPETLFDDTSMASLRGAPVTDLHPSALVTPETWGEVAVGHVGDDVAAGGGASSNMLEASVLIQDAEEIRRIEAGERVEVSAGYVCDVDPTPGVYGGEPYEGVQRNRRYNHVALGPVGWARAGASARLRLDGAAIAVQRAVAAQENDVKKKLKIRGREYRLDADAGAEDEVVKAQDAVSEMEAEATKKDQDLAGLQSQCQALQKAITDALSQVAQLQAAIAAKEATAAPVVTEEQVPEEILDAALAKRSTLHADARAVLGADTKLDGLKPAAIKRAVVAKALPSMKLDGLDDKTVEGMYLAAVAGAKTADTARTDALQKAGSAALPGARTDHHDGAADRSAALQKRLEEQGRAPIFAGGKA